MAREHSVHCCATCQGYQRQLETLTRIFGIPPATLGSWAKKENLMLLKIKYNPSGPGDHAGTNFFTHNVFGEFTDQLEQVRSYLGKLRCDKTTDSIKALVRSTGSFALEVETLSEEIKSQSQQDPLYDWWENRKVNCQLGMELSGGRPQYTLPAWPMYFSIDEYLTILFYGILEQHEEAKRHKATWHHVNVRLAALPFGGRKYFMFVEMEAGLRLSPGDELEVCFDFETDARLEDWRARVITQVPFATSQDYTAILTRPFQDGQEGEFSEPQIPKESVIELQDQTDTEFVRQKITYMKPIAVKIKVRSSTGATQRQISTLNKVQLHMSSYAAELELLKGTNLRRFPKIDAFGYILANHSEAELEKAIKRQCSKHNPEQQQANRALREIPAGTLLIQGPPGTGKTTWIIDLIAVCFTFANDGSSYSHHTTLWSQRAIGRPRHKDLRSIVQHLQRRHDQSKVSYRDPRILGREGGQHLSTGAGHQAQENS